MSAVFYPVGEIARRPADLNNIPFDSELTPGARNAVHVCLRIQPSEKVTVITDEVRKEIAASMVHELEQVGAPYHALVLEELAPRPLTDLPQEILDDLETSQVSIFAVQAQTNELKSRMQMTDVVNRRKIRHAHMVNINRQIMLEGMRADFLKVDRISTKVVEMVRKASQIRAKTAAGTDLAADAESELQWLKTSGIISPDKWGNLPGGEVFTTPGEVNGTFVIDGVVGDYLCAKFGDLKEKPLTIQVKGNRLIGGAFREPRTGGRISGSTRTPMRTAIAVGEFAIGTNIELKDVIGQILQDEKYPGDSHCVRESVRRAYRGGVVFVDAHRRGGAKVRYLGGRRADHAGREVFDRGVTSENAENAEKFRRERREKRIPPLRLRSGSE